MIDPLPQRPAVWPWYVAYCAFFALIYLFIAVLGLLGLFGFAFLDSGDVESAFLSGAILLALGLSFSTPFAVAPFLRPRPWTWVLGVALIAFGMLSCCTLPASIPLLIYWINPETQRWFGRAVESTSPAQSAP